ncbi:LPXTG cell wall anchor domain-containing protein [Staphylococcus aureus]
MKGLIKMMKKGNLIKIISSMSVALMLSTLAVNPTVEAKTDNSTPNDTPIQKFILNKGKLVKNTKIKKGDKVKFLIKSELMSEQPITNFKITDDFENVFDIDKNIEVYIPKDDSTKQDSLNFKQDFINVTNEGVVNVNEDSENFEWIANNPDEFRGKTIYLLVNSTIKKDIDYKKFTSDKDILISNVAKEQINSKEFASNKVNLIIKSEPDSKLLFAQNELRSQYINLDLLNDKKNKKANNINQIQQTTSKSKDVENSNNKIRNSHNKVTLNITSEEIEKDRSNNNQIQDSNKKNVIDHNNEIDEKIEKDKKSEITNQNKKVENNDRLTNGGGAKDNKNVDTKTKIDKSSDKSLNQKTLPNTGMKDNIIFTILGSVIIFISCILLFRVYKNRKKC